MRQKQEIFTTGNIKVKHFHQNNKIVIATLNQNKIKEYQSILAPHGFEAISPEDVGLKLQFDETGATYAENAMIKAKALSALTDMIVLADDSGLSVKALDGFPGLHSHRFMLGKNDAEKNLALIEKLLPFADKSAEFICAIALILPGQIPQIFTGVAPGYILPKPIGQQGFGYDPIFYSTEASAPFATLSLSEKNRFSHRGKATSQLLAYLKTLTTIH